MKSRLFPVMAVIGIVVFSFSACTTNPDWVLEHFTKHWFKGELEECKPYLTQESQKYTDLLKNLKSPEELEKMSKTKVEINVMEVTNENDSIRVYHCKIILDGIAQDVDIRMKQLKHRWFIDIAN